MKSFEVDCVVFEAIVQCFVERVIKPFYCSCLRASSIVQTIVFYVERKGPEKKLYEDLKKRNRGKE